MADQIAARIEQTVAWLREQVANSGTRGLVVGVSGGIDSALCAFLIQKAFPAESLGIILPCKSNPQDRKDALLVIEACGIKHLEVELTDIHAALTGKLEFLLESSTGGWQLSDANLRARLRMSTLYFVANALNYLVVGTDNAAEVYTGYYTKYGDGGVDILPLARLRKRDVREWSRVLGVPAAIIDKAPSAGLWAGQTDEGEMGTTYDIIDDFLDGKTIPDRDLQIIERLHRRSEHKRCLPPVPPEF